MLPALWNFPVKKQGVTGTSRTEKKTLFGLTAFKETLLERTKK